MADSKTLFYQLTNPEVGASFDSWGDKENADRTLIDLLMANPRPAIVDSSAGGVLDMDDALVQQLVLAGNLTVTFDNVPEAESGGAAVSTFLWVLLFADGTSSVTWPVEVTWVSDMPAIPAAGWHLLLLITGDEGAGWTGYQLDYIGDLAVTTAKLNDLAVTTAKLAADAVTNAKLADNAVQNENILNGTIAQAKLAFSVQTAAELPVHIAQATYDGSNAATQGIMDVLVSVGLAEVS